MRLLKIQIILPCMLFILSGCMVYSKTHLIDVSNAVDPFGDSPFYKLTEDDGNVFLLEKRTDKTFTMHMEDDAKRKNPPRIRFQRYPSYFFLGSMRKYFFSMSFPIKDGETYLFGLLVLDEIGKASVYFEDTRSETLLSKSEYYKSYEEATTRLIEAVRNTIKSKTDQKFRELAKSNKKIRLAIEMNFVSIESLTYEERNAFFAEFRAKEEAKKVEAEKVAKAKEMEAEKAARETVEREKKDQILELLAKEMEAANNKRMMDREPTEREMSMAIRRSTVFGALVEASVTKLGCFRLGEQHYRCKYRYVGVNDGEFWKYKGAWRFHRIE